MAADKELIFSAAGRDDHQIRAKATYVPESGRSEGLHRSYMTTIACTGTLPSTVPYVKEKDCCSETTLSN